MPVTLAGLTQTPPLHGGASDTLATNADPGAGLEQFVPPRVFFREAAVMEHLASAMATIAFSAVLLVTALFYVDRLYPQTMRADPIVQSALTR
jgi:hypothetical protein